MRRNILFGMALASAIAFAGCGGGGGGGGGSSSVVANPATGEGGAVTLPTVDTSGNQAAPRDEYSNLNYDFEVTIDGESYKTATSSAVGDFPPSPPVVTRPLKGS